MSNVHVLYWQEGREPVIPVNVYMECGSDCTGRLECVDPFQPHVEGETMYEHRCTVCNNRVDFDEVYPHIEYDDLGKYIENKCLRANN